MSKNKQPILKTEVAICGAGIAGVSAAYFLSNKFGVRDVVLIDQGSPLSLTSDHSTECYRNWWPGPDGAMVSLMNRSIHLMEEIAKDCGNAIQLNRRGYLYCSDNADNLDRIIQDAEAISSFGAGPIRVHKSITNNTYKPSDPEGYTNQPDGADVLVGPKLIRNFFPYLSNRISLGLHVRKAGWLSAQQLGMYLLEKARQAGTRFLNSRVVGVDTQDGRVCAVFLENGQEIKTQTFVLASGPYLKETARNFFSLDLPVDTELHLKTAMPDPFGVLHRDAPLVIYNEKQTLDWNHEEIEFLISEGKHQLLGELPAGVHTRPEGSQNSNIILLLWEYNARAMEPVFPIPPDPYYLEVTLRGIQRIIPGFSKYLSRLPKPRIDGGYYTKTPENRPLICELPTKGAYILGALSGFGIMSACAAGELIAKNITSAPLPGYAAAFNLTRYEDENYLQMIKEWENTGEL